MKILNRLFKKIDYWDISLIKLAVVAFVLFIITIWPDALAWVISVNPLYFLILFVAFATRPLYHVCIK